MREKKLIMEDRHWKIISHILAKYPYTFYAFGSRAKGTPKPLSDLDLCYFEDIPINALAHLAEDFEESNLPYKVDIVDWKSCDEVFRGLIQRDLVFIQGDPKILEKQEAKNHGC